MSANPNTYPLMESIALIDGEFRHLRLHQERINLAQKQLLKLDLTFQLEDWLNQFSIPQKGFYKCRLLYGEHFKSPEFIPYTFKAIRSLKLIHANELDYAHKYSDRTAINEAFSTRQFCDDILIVKDGLITDSSYCNIAFQKKSQWFTPAKPLLQGVQRRFLLQQGTIMEAEIRPTDLTRFTAFRLFNAMIDWHAAIEIPINAIY